MFHLKPTIKAVIAVFLFLITNQNALAHDEIKIAVVDLELIVAKSSAGKNLQARLIKFQELIKAEVDSKNQEVSSLRNRIVDGSGSLSETQLNDIQKQLEDLQINIKRYVDDKQREVQKMQAEGLKNIEASLEPVFQKIKSDNNYDLILNNVPGVVIMSSDKVDITNAVIDLLNNGD